MQQRKQSFLNKQDVAALSSRLFNSYTIAKSTERCPVLTELYYVCLANTAPTSLKDYEDKPLPINNKFYFDYYAFARWMPKLQERRQERYLTEYALSHELLASFLKDYRQDRSVVPSSQAIQKPMVTISNVNAAHLPKVYDVETFPFRYVPHFLFVMTEGRYYINNVYIKPIRRSEVNLRRYAQNTQAFWHNMQHSEAQQAQLMQSLFAFHDAKQKAKQQQQLENQQQQQKQDRTTLCAPYRQKLEGCINFELEEEYVTYQS